MTVKALVPGRERDEAVLVLETEDRVLGLRVPIHEATRLARALGTGPCRCSPIDDLLLDLAAAAQARVARAVLDLTPGGIGAQVVFVWRETETRHDCHPADAVGLAVRTGAPIYATADALGQACPQGHHRPAPDGAATARWLDRVRPEDFEDPEVGR
jgi:bifunctional DNase/RNase